MEKIKVYQMKVKNRICKKKKQKIVNELRKEVLFINLRDVFLGIHLSGCLSEMIKKKENAETSESMRRHLQLKRHDHISLLCSSLQESDENS